MGTCSEPRLLRKTNIWKKAFISIEELCRPQWWWCSKRRAYNTETWTAVIIFSFWSPLIICFSSFGISRWFSLAEVRKTHKMLKILLFYDRLFRHRHLWVSLRYYIICLRSLVLVVQISYKVLGRCFQSLDVSACADHSQEELASYLKPWHALFERFFRSGIWWVL